VRHITERPITTLGEYVDLLLDEPQAPAGPERGSNGRRAR
jgi:hypothetical protein